jgi:hypothetical protein
VTTILATLSDELDRRGMGSPSSSPRGPRARNIDGDDDAAAPLAFGEPHKLWRLRLAPLRGVQADLEARLGAGAMEPDWPAGAGAGAATSALDLRPRRDSMDDAASAVVAHTYAAALPPRDFFVRSTNGWKSALDKLHGRRPSGAVDPEPQPHDDVAEVLANCREDMKALWADESVRELLKRRQIRLADTPGL